MKIVPVFFSLALILVGCDTPPEAEPSNSQLLVYPNPALNDVFIDVYPPDGKSFVLRVFDTQGEMILEETGVEAKEYNLPLYGKPEGAYHVVLKVGSSTVTQKLIKL